jgi:hypothetical protein
MEVSSVRLPILWKRALTARGLSQGNDMATQIRLAISEFIEKEGIQLY